MDNSAVMDIMNITKMKLIQLRGTVSVYSRPYDLLTSHCGYIATSLTVGIAVATHINCFKLIPLPRIFDYLFIHLFQH